MEVTQEPLDNKKNQKKEETVLPLSSGNPNEPVTPAPKEQPVPASKDEAPITEIKAKVDLTRKPAEASEPVTLMDGDDFFKQQTNPTEGDIKQKEEDKRKADALKDKLSSSSDNPSPSPSSSTPKTPLTADKRQKQAEKWVKVFDMVNTWGLKKWSGQADDVGLKTAESDKVALAEALADVMEEYNFNPAPLLTLAITTVGVFGNSWTNAYESRRKIRKFAKEHPEKVEEAEKASVKTKPDLDPATGKHNRRRGAQFKS